MSISSSAWRGRLLRSRALSPLLLLLLWELGSRSGVIPERTLAAPSAVVSTMIEMILSGELPDNLIVSFWRAAIGLTSMYLSFRALALLPLAEATTISFAAPLFAIAMSALLLGEALTAFVAYDHRLLGAARAAGLDVVAPGQAAPSPPGSCA